MSRSVELKCGLKKYTQPWPMWLSWLERCRVHQRTTGSIPGQGTCRRQPIDVSHIDVSLYPSFLSLNQLKKNTQTTFYMLGSEKDNSHNHPSYYIMVACSFLNFKRIKERNPIHIWLKQCTCT